MLYDPPEKFDYRLGEGLVLFSGAVFVSKGDHTVMTRQDVIFLDNPGIQIVLAHFLGHSGVPGGSDRTGMA